MSALASPPRWIRQASLIAAMAAVYYITGRLSLLLAIPPGYATAVWPAAGIALAGVLLFGYGVWSGILLGHFFVNLFTSLDASTTETILKSSSIALGIAVGGALEALTGAFLVRRFVGFPNPLTKDRDILKFLILGGPISCLMAPTWGVTCLLIAGIVPWANYSFSWVTWWVGDTIGVLTMTPLVLIFAAEPREIWRGRKVTVALPLFVAFAMVLVFFLYARAWEQDRARMEFERLAKNFSESVAETIGEYTEILHSIAAFYASSLKMERQEFRTFVERFLQRHQGIQALEWIPRVHDGQRAAYEEAARRDGYPHFQITERNAQGQMVRASLRGEYFSVLYVEPYKGNEAALGFDLASDFTRRQTLERARDTGEITASSRIILVQEISKQFGTLVFLPIYKKNLPHNTMEERRQNFQGFALGVFRIGDIVETAQKSSPLDRIEFEIYDEMTPAKERLLYIDRLPKNEASASTDAEEARNVTGLRWSATLDVAGRRWTLRFSPTLDYLTAHRSWQAWTMLATGLLFTSLLGGFLLILTGRSAEIEHLVGERTAQLSHANDSMQQEIAERKKTEEQVRRQKEQIATLHEINLASTSTLDINAVLEILMKKINVLLPYTAVQVWLLDQESGEMTRAACWNLDETDWKGRKLTQLPVLVGEAIESKRPVMARNVQTDPRTLDAEFYRRHGLISYLGVPLIAKGDVLGVLVFLTREEHTFTADEIDFLSTLAAQAAIGIQNSQLHEQIKRQSVALAEANTQLADFTAMIVHDLRSPLSAMISVSHLLENDYCGPLNDEQRKWLAKLQAQEHGMLDLINDFMDFSKLEAGRIDLTKTDVDLKQQVETLLQTYCILAEQKGLSLSHDIGSDLPHFSGDARRLDQVFHNLLSNAIKFTPQDGRIEVGASLQGSQIKVSVKDSGVGIPVSEIENLFQKYSQTTSGKTSPQKGTGLGLVICKMIVEAHGGKIWAESEKNKGTTFFFTLPTH
jgi:signal transduction histidine kinase/integral membrane sensor domain MASE1